MGRQHDGQATGDCGHACAYVAPYGFVPEANCPVHDTSAPERRMSNTKQSCQRCGRGIPSRRIDTGFCSDKCAAQQAKADENSAASERAAQAAQERKPRLTAKVVRGLDAIRAAVEAGEMLAGDLASDADDAQSALEWISRMADYRNQKT